MSTDPSELATATVSITLHKFHKIGGDHSFSSADVVLTGDANGAVTQSGDNQPIVVNTEVNIALTVTGEESDRFSYAPVGICFQLDRNSKDPVDPTGALAFPDRTISADPDTQAVTLTLLDTNPEQNSFEFDVIVQRSDGPLTVVDPKIENTGINR